MNGGRQVPVVPVFETQVFRERPQVGRSRAGMLPGAERPVDGYAPYYMNVTKTLDPSYLKGLLRLALL